MAPIKTVKEKGVQVAIWATNNGGYSYSMSKRYKDKTSGEWKESKYLYKEEVEALVRLLQEVLAYSNDRDTHIEEGIPSGQDKVTEAPFSGFEDDDIPF